MTDLYKGDSKNNPSTAIIILRIIRVVGVADPYKIAGQKM